MRVALFSTILAPPYEAVARFAGNLATCLESGLEMGPSLRTAKRALDRTRVAGAMDVVLTRVQQGAPLSEALAAVQWGLPAFFVPMVEAGEQTGRLDDALRYLEHHCKMLAQPARALQNAWLVPLAIALAGTAIKLAAHVTLAPWGMTITFLLDSFKSYMTLGVLVFIAAWTPVRPLLDEFYLVLPVVGSVEREIAANRFFHALGMLYAAGGRRVEQMIRLAARTVRNRALRADLLQVARQIERGAGVPEAFEVSCHVSREQQDWIASGDLSGTLERAFEHISTEAGERLSMRLKVFSQIFFRVMTLFVVLSVTSTLLGLIRLRHQ